jgi:hypothetical protein
VSLSCHSSMKKIFLVIAGITVALVSFETWRWMSIQPTHPKITIYKKVASPSLPEKNKRMLSYVETNGRSIAPEYHPVVCTEFLIKVLDRFEPLTKLEKRDIRIITEDNLVELIEAEAAIIKGVQNALTKSGKGIVIEDPAKVLPGDLVQFWDTFYGGAWGHCGIVSELEPNKTLTLHSSHPFTNGYGIQTFNWPEKVFFVRLTP